jgi:hypothetical protein
VPTGEKERKPRSNPIFIRAESGQLSFLLSSQIARDKDPSTPRTSSSPPTSSFISRERHGSRNSIANSEHRPCRVRVLCRRLTLPRRTTPPMASLLTTILGLSQPRLKALLLRGRFDSSVTSIRGTRKYHRSVGLRLWGPFGAK